MIHAVNVESLNVYLVEKVVTFEDLEGVSVNKCLWCLSAYALVSIFEAFSSVPIWLLLCSAVPTTSDRCRFIECDVTRQ